MVCPWEEPWNIFEFFFCWCQSFLNNLTLWFPPLNKSKATFDYLWGCNEGGILEMIGKHNFRILTLPRKKGLFHISGGSYGPLGVHPPLQASQHFRLAPWDCNLLPVLQWKLEMVCDHCRELCWSMESMWHIFTYSPPHSDPLPWLWTNWNEIFKYCISNLFSPLGSSFSRGEMLMCLK